MLPSQRASSRDRARHGPRKTVIVYRCPRCRTQYACQPYIGSRAGCPTCSWLGYLNRVRVRD